MEFRYDFADKLDLSRFKKQGAYYIGAMREVTFNFFLLEYKIVAEIVTSDNARGHMVTTYFFDLVRNESGEIVGSKAVVPLIDTRFKEISNIQKIFTIDHYKAYFDSNSADVTVQKLCNLISLVHKINNLKVFL